MPCAAFAALAMLAFPAAAGAQTAPRREPIGQSTATLTPAIRVGNTVYTSGQLGLSDPVDTTIAGQTRRSLEKIKRIVEQAGTTMPNVVKCTVFLTEAADFQGMNAVYQEFFPVAPPGRSTVIVKALVAPAAKVEIECIAVMPER